MVPKRRPIPFLSSLSSLPAVLLPDLPGTLQHNPLVQQLQQPEKRLLVLADKSEDGGSAAKTALAAQTNTEEADSTAVVEVVKTAAAVVA